MSFEEHIKKWVHLDSEIKDLNEKQKELRNKKNQLCNSIMNEVEEKNLQQAIINITDGKLKFAQTKQTAPLTLSFIDRCLKEVIPNENQVELIMNYIKEKRESKMISEIKRYYSN